MVIDLADPRKQNTKLIVGKNMKNPIYPEEHPKDSKTGCTRYLCKWEWESMKEGFVSVCLRSKEIPKSSPWLHVARQLPRPPLKLPQPIHNTGSSSSKESIAEGLGQGGIRYRWEQVYWAILKVKGLRTFWIPPISPSLSSSQNSSNKILYLLQAGN